MAGGGKSGGDSYWPGFVDALTNVVIAMIFVVVVLALSLSFAAQMMGKKIAEQAVKEYEAKARKAAAAAPPPSPVAATDVKAVAGAAVPPLPESALRGITRIAVAPGAAASGAMARVRAAENRLQLDYDRQALELDPKALQALRESVAQLGGDLARRRVRLVATVIDPSISDNQRAAYVRLLAVRNALLDQGFVPANVEMQIDTQQATPTPSVWATFE